MTAYQAHLFFPPPASTSTNTRLEDDFHDILESVSRLASGAGTPIHPSSAGGTRAAGPGHGAVSAEELVAQLASRASSPFVGLTTTPPATTPFSKLPLREWTVGSPMDLIVLSGKGGGVIPLYRLPNQQEPIDLDLYDLQCHLLPAGYLLRFTLLEWDEVRLDRLMVSLKRSLREGAQARVGRTLLHDAFWSWRLQITIYLGCANSTNPDAFLPRRFRTPAGLISAL